MTFPGLVQANNLSDIGDKEKAWDNLGENISFGELNSDLYSNNVSLLLHGDGANGSTTITDSSQTQRMVTAVGNAQISTAQSRFGGASIAFDGSGDRLTLASGSDWNFSNGPHTFECWFRLNTLPNTGNNLRLAMAGPNDSLSSFVFLLITSTGIVAAGVPSYLATGLAHPSTVITNTWYHYACVLNGASSAMYLDGAGAFGAMTMPTSSNTNQLFIGFDTVGTVNFNLNGYIDDLRITKGIARYTASFTPPTTPFPSTTFRYTVKGRDILALNNARAVFPRNFILIKGLSAPVQPRLNVATQNTASGVALSNALLLKQSPSSIGAYSILNGTLNAQQLKINGIQASSLSSSPFSGSAALFPLSITTMELSSNFRLVPLFSSGTVVSPTIGMPVETIEFFLYAKTGQS
jgi:hypothetical protein